MSDPYLGEIRLFAGNYAPVNWHLCDGTLLPISTYSALFSLIGTAYGGNGTSTFGLPDLRGRLGIHEGQGSGLSNYVLGQAGGALDVTLNSQTAPAHTHSLNTSGTAASTPNTGPTVTFANTAGQNVMYVNNGASGATQVSPASTTISQSGGGLPHSNLMPGLTVNYIICLNGIYPQFQ
ncbi:MAG TPA: tail fiber protein [Burkholderiales bacterium]|nr:tail fiber protein [Burkholderiales bacterium]